MITIFTTTKEFLGIHEIIQMNALRSWRSISNNIEIIIFGNSVGTKNMAYEVGAKYIPNVKCSERGTPLLSDLFQQADKIAKHSILVYINADIVLPNNFLDKIIVSSKHLKNFLMIGHRWDMDVKNLVSFDNEIDRNMFWNRAEKNSKMHACTGIDYFVYNKKQWGKIPDFIIGRPGFDNWLIWKARRNCYPVIDCTGSIKVIHQNHPTKKHYKKEGDINKKLHAGRTLNILDSTYKLIDGEISKKNDIEFNLRNLHRLPRIFPELSIFIKLYRRYYKWHLAK